MEQWAWLIVLCMARPRPAVLPSALFGVGSVQTRATSCAGAAPAWTCAAVVDCGLLGRTCGDEVVVEVDVVELDNLRQRRNRRRDDPADLVALELGEPHFSVGSADDSRRLRRGRRIAYSSIAPDIVMRPTRRSAAATGSRIERHLTQPSSTRDLRAGFRRCVCCTYFVYCICWL